MPDICRDCVATNCGGIQSIFDVMGPIFDAHSCVQQKCYDQCKCYVKGDLCAKRERADGLVAYDNACMDKIQSQMDVWFPGCTACLSSSSMIVASVVMTIFALLM
jgi:hypothetical protein